MSAFGRSLERYLHQAVWGKPAPRAPRRRPRRGAPRSRAYKAWITGLPSVVSELPGCDPCHTVNNGMRSKGSDFSCVPLTREEHREYDAGREAFEQKYGIVMAEIVADLNLRWQSIRP